MKKSSDDVAIQVNNLTKTFKIPLEPTNRLKSRVTGIFKRNKGYRKFTPLKDISLEIKKGEFFGIVGRNGSGKSTLLKSIAGIYTPNGGSVKVNGSLVPFIELGVGFNPELSGRENVYLNGALLGFSRSEIDSIYNEIVDFAELHEFMEEKLKNYSSGMQVRLAFSVAIQTNADILVLDEVLAVGDAAFQQKCFDYFEDLKNNKQTVVFVTHDMGAVRRFCSRAIYIEDGKIKHQGSPIDIADIYTEVNIDKSNQSQNQKDKEADTNQVSIEIVEPKKRSFSQDEKLKLGVVVNGIEEQVFANFSLSANGIIFSDRNSRDMPNEFIQNGKKIEFVQPIADLNPGKYDVYISIHRSKDDSTLKHLPRAYSFVVKGKDILRDGPMRSMGEWR